MYRRQSELSRKRCRYQGQELLRLGAQPGWEHIPAAGLGRVMLGRILYERNDLYGAQDALVTGIAELEGFSLKRAEIIGCILLARVKLALEEVDEAHTILEQAWNTIQFYDLKQITIPAPAYHARLLMQMDDLKTAVQWATTIERPTDGLLNPALEYDYITLARVQMAQGWLDEAQNLLARLLLPAEESGRVARVIEILALLAVIASVQQDNAGAITALERALSLAKPEGFVRSFVDEDEPMRQLLIDHQSIIKKKMGYGVDSESLQLLQYTDKLLAAFSQPGPDEKTKDAPLLEPLNERELDVLRLIATGRSNKEIAEILVVAVSTVKWYINNLYSKLGAKSRTHALALAKELELI
ncbi:MAG: LuxR C-terminal-related transcriptional regulator [Anaerolineales bacterium]